MKFRIVLTIILMISLLTGCSAVPFVEGSREEDRIGEERASTIALEHAGFTAEQVEGMHVSFDYDDGRPEYDVQFRQGYWEYEYEIHAVSGKILSYDRDD